MIPLCDLTCQYASLKSEIDCAMRSVAAQGHYILGPNVQALEREIAAFCGCRHAIGVGNGTDALHLALRALGVGVGDEVITTPFTFVATTEAIAMVGATPVFVDIDPKTFNIDPRLIEPAITSKTKAILPVHLYGQPCDMEPIMTIAHKHGLLLVEDCAQAMGASYRGRSVGSFGDAGCLSFFPSKNLGCFGDGGMVVCNSEEIADRVEMLRRHGGRVKYHHEEVGLNSRLDELQAAILRVKLPNLESWNAIRRERAFAYNRLLSDLPTVVCPSELTDHGESAPWCQNAVQGKLHAVYHQYTILVQNRDEVAQELTRAEIGNAVYYPIPLHLQEVHANLGHRVGDCPCAEHAAKCCLSLPMFPELNEQQQFEVVEAIRTVCSAQRLQGSCIRRE